MIQSIESYIITNGCGQEAVRFYQAALGAEIEAYTLWGQIIPDCPEDRKELLLNAQLRVNGIRLQLSDENPDYPYQAGRNVSIALIVDSVETAEKIYKSLSVQAQEILLELQETFWSPAYANFVDQYGVLWQISTEIKDEKNG